MLALTKYLHWQNSRVDKILASTTFLRQQNTRVDKILVSTKFSCQQNVGAGAEVSPYCLARQSPQQLTSPRPRWCSPTSPRRCWSLHMQSPSMPLPLAALLLWADSLRTVLAYCTGPPCRKHHKYWQRQTIGTPQDFTDFCQTIAVNISAHRRLTKNLVKTKSDHHHCLISLYILTTSKIEAITEIHRWGLWLLKRGVGSR